MGQDFETQIQQRRNSLTGILQEMERILAAFGAASARHAASWIEAQVTKAVEHEHAVTSKLTDEETKKFTEIGESMGRCMQTAMGGGTP